MSAAWRQQEGEPAADWLVRLEGVALRSLDGWTLASLRIYIDAARRQIEQDRMGAAKVEATAEAEAGRVAASVSAEASASQARRAATEDLSHRALSALARPRRAPDLGEVKAAYRRLTTQQRQQFAAWLARGAPDDAE